MGTVVCKLYCPFGKDEHGMEFPLFALTFDISTCCGETGCSCRRECSLLL